MKNKLIKNFALMLSLTTMLTTLPVNAYEVDEYGMSIENVEYQTSTDEDFTNKTNVFAEIGSTYQVTIPKVIVLSGETKSAEYKVSAEGDIAGYETIFVRPDRTVNLYAVNKVMQVGLISQDKTGWTNNTIDEIGNGLIEADGITAGRWSGTFNFEIFLNRVLGDVIVPGHEHVLSEVQIENLIKSTCTESGSYDEVVYCTECYTEISRGTKTTDALGHKPLPAVEEESPEATETDHFYDEVVYCEVCGEEISRTLKGLSLPYSVLDLSFSPTLNAWVGPAGQDQYMYWTPSEQLDRIPENCVIEGEFRRLGHMQEIVQISEDGENWTTILSNPYNGSGDWVKRSASLESYTGKKIFIRLAACGKVINTPVYCRINEVIRNLYIKSANN